MQGLVGIVKVRQEPQDASEVVHFLDISILPNRSQDSRRVWEKKLKAATIPPKVRISIEME